jgi:MscS family membrane protein
MSEPSLPLTAPDGGPDDLAAAHRGVVMLKGDLWEIAISLSEQAVSWGPAGCSAPASVADWFDTQQRVSVLRLGRSGLFEGVDFRRLGGKGFQARILAQHAEQEQPGNSIPGPRRKNIDQGATGAECVAFSWVSPPVGEQLRELAMVDGTTRSVLDRPMPDTTTPLPTSAIPEPTAVATATPLDDAAAALPLLEQTFYGNTISDWGVAAIIIVATAVGAKLGYLIIGRVAKQLTAKTKTKLDDIIIDNVEEPFVLVVAAAGIVFGLRTLNLPESVDGLVGNAFFLTVTVAIAWLLTRLFEALSNEYITPLIEKSDSDLDDQLFPIFRKAVKGAIWAMAIVLGLQNVGYDIGAILAGLGIGGLAFALAAQDTVANLFGGITIFLDKPFSVNERVKVQGYDGMIRDIGLRSTRLQTLEGRIVTIPNKTFTDNAVENVSSEPSRKVALKLGLTYDTDAAGMRKAMDLLKQITEDSDGVDDGTLVAFTDFGDFALGILCIYYINKDADILDTQSVVNLVILEKFGEAKLDMAFPTQTIYALNSAA